MAIESIKDFYSQFRSEIKNTDILKIMHTLSNKNRLKSLNSAPQRRYISIIIFNVFFNN